MKNIFQKLLIKYLLIFLISIGNMHYIFAQSPKKVTGRVMDAQGELLIGVNVTEADNPSNGVVTDINGTYTIVLSGEKPSLKFSYIGFKDKVLPIGSKGIIDVSMEEDVAALDEVVVVGFGTQKKASVVGSITNIEPAKLAAAPSRSLSNNLAGMLPGVIAVQRSGDPWFNNSDFWIRGISSFTGNTNPLVLVDGIERSLHDIDPEEIASFSVLKDAAASAVYGVRGANGVILVTTKNPEKDKLTVSFNAFANIKTVAKYPDNLSPYEYANLVNDYGKEYFGYGDNHFYSPEQLEAFKSGKAGYDYSREIFRSPAVTQNYELSIAGGGEKTTFLASLRYQDDQGIIKESGSQIYSWRLKVDTKIKKWLKAGLNIYGHYRETSKPRITEYDGLIQQSMYFPSTIEPKNEEGEYNNSFFDGGKAYNPMGYIWESSNSNKTINNRIQGYVQFDILDGLSFRSQLGVLFDNRLNTSVENEDSYYSYKNSLTQG